MIKYILIGFLIQGFISSLYAGNEDFGDDFVIESKTAAPNLLDHNPLFHNTQIAPMIAFGLNIPINMKSKPQRSFAIYQDSGNTYTPEVHALCDGKECSREYAADFIGTKTFVTYSQPILEKNEITFTMGIYQINGGTEGNPLNYATSDHFVEWFHANALGQSDPVGRRADGFDKAYFYTTDREGRTTRLEKKNIYVMPIRIDLTHYETLIDNSNNLLTANIGLHFGIPVFSELTSHASVGMSANIVYTRKLSKNYSISFLAGFNAIDQKVVRLNDNADLYDKNMQYGASLAISFAKQTKNGKYFINVGYAGRTSNWHYTDYVWDQKELADHAERATSGSNEYIFVGLGYETANWFFQLSVREDLTIFSGLVDSEELHDGGGSNLEDWGISLTLQRKF
jgi:hypothetical protein